MLTQRVVKGGTWLLVGKLIANVVGLVSSIVIAHYLLPADYGLAAIAGSTLLILSSFVELPTSAALIHLPDVNDDDFNAAWTIGVLKGFAIAAMLVVAAWPMAILFNDARLINVLLVLAIYPIILGFRNSFFENFARHLQFEREVILDILSKFASFFATVGISVFLRSYWALPLGMMASGVAQMLTTYWFCRKTPHLSLKSFSRIFNLSAWLTGTSIIIQLKSQADTLIIGRLLGQAPLGQVALGGQFVNRVDEVTRNPLFRSLFAAFSQMQKDPERLRRAYRSAQGVCVACLLPVGLGIGLLAEPGVMLLYGPHWSIAALVVAFLGPVLGFLSMIAPTQSLALALGHGRTLFLRDAAALLIRLPLIVVGLLTNGVLGLLVAGVIAESVMLGVNLMMVRVLIDIPIVDQLKNVGRSWAAGAIMYFGLRPAAGLVPLDGPIAPRLAELAAIGLAGAALYVGAHFVLWQMAGRPEGVESRFIGVVESILARVKKFGRQPRG